MRIGNLALNGRTILAPLAGVTNFPFRRIVKQCGVALVCSEMVSARGMMYQSEKTADLLRSTVDESPLSVQIFGADALSMATAARMIAARKEADIIDINFGCSVRKVVKTGAGVALMKDVKRAAAIVTAVRRAISLPLTIKIRSGWDASGRDAFETAAMAQACGADAVVLHPRTATQAFRGQADWDLIRQLKEKMDIPVIGNGDIVTPHDAVRMMGETGCDAVMVGRAAMGNPFIFSHIEALLAGRELPPPSPDQQFDVMRRLLDAYVDHFGETTACKMMRSRLVWFVRGWKGCSRFRRALTTITSSAEALALINGYEERLMEEHLMN